MPISGYTEEAFKFGAMNMPSPFKQDYRQGKDGLWYFKGGDGGVKKEEPYKSPGALAASAAGAEARIRASMGGWL